MNTQLIMKECFTHLEEWSDQSLAILAINPNQS